MLKNSIFIMFIRNYENIFVFAVNKKQNMQF
jgi:hypothetical protein